MMVNVFLMVALTLADVDTDDIIVTLVYARETCMKITDYLNAISSKSIASNQIFRCQESHQKRARSKKAYVSNFSNLHFSITFQYRKIFLRQYFENKI